MSVLGALMIAAVSLPACKARPAYQGADRSIVAAYRIRKLRTELPPSVRVQAVVLAADAALRDRGYAVTSSRATEESGHIEAEPRGAGDFESVEVTARVIASGTRIEIRINPWGDEPKSRAILDGILARLGL